MNTPFLARLSAALGLTDRSAPAERVVALSERLAALDADIAHLEAESYAQHEADAARAASGERLDVTASIAAEHRATAFRAAREGLVELLAQAERAAATERRKVLATALGNEVIEARQRYAAAWAAIAVATRALAELGASRPSGLPSAANLFIDRDLPTMPRAAAPELAALEAAGGGMEDLPAELRGGPFADPAELPIEAAEKALRKLLGPPSPRVAEAAAAQRAAAQRQAVAHAEQEAARVAWHTAIETAVAAAAGWRLRDRDRDKAGLALSLVRECGRLGIGCAKLAAALSAVEPEVTVPASSDELHSLIGWASGRRHP